jgi:membrane protease YdiL (CAAX protease family)
MTTDTPAVPSFRLGLLLWLAGMLGVVVLTFTVLPQLLRDVAIPAPLWLISLASLAQSGLLLALAVWAGVTLAPKVGLRASAFEAAVTARPIAPALRPQLLPGLVAGVLGGILLFVISRYAPAAIMEVQERFSPPLLARVLYGGITEEILLRWGFMTALVWLAWRFLQHRRGAPRTGYVWLAIAVSAVAFGAGHLPAAQMLTGALNATVVAFVVGANTAFGLLFGYLYWRHGLESAMIAHLLAHAFNYLANLL